MSKYKVGDKVILHRDRVAPCELDRIEFLLDLKHEEWELVEVKVACLFGHAVSVEYATGWRAMVSVGWVTKVEEKEDTPPTDSLVALEDSYIANQEEDPNQEMIDSDMKEYQKQVTRELLSMPLPEDLQEQVSPMGAVEKVGRALSITQTVHNHQLGLIQYFDKEYLD